MAVLPGYPQEAPYEVIQVMLHQMRKTICKIGINDVKGTGFFCKIPFPDLNNMLRVLITNNHIINRNLLFKKDTKMWIGIKEETDYKVLNLNNRIKYTNEEFNITIIEIKDEDKINSFLELDEALIKDIIMNSNKNNKFIEETIYAMQYLEGRLSVSFGILDKIYVDRKYKFIHKCCKNRGSGGSPILNINNNKVIGLHCEGNIRYNKGIFLNYPIKEFIKLNFDNEFLLKEFNNKYNLNIKDTKIEKLDLRWKGLGNIGFEDLCKIEFKELKELILNNNNISEIKILSKAKFKKLEILDLSQNKISNINIFENINFKGLKQLYLCHNNISDIKVFERANLKNLEILYLNDNKIDKKKNALIIQNLKSKIGNFQV